MMSVVLASHNGADTIERTLKAMSQLDPPEGGWKLVIVNNASTDATGALIRKWRDRLPLEYLVEPRLGKARAINKALARAEGDLIVMTDDDVLPDKDWLTELRRVAGALPDCAVFGGAIIPDFDGCGPPWPMPGPWRTILYAQTPDYEEGEIEPCDVLGANMTIRKSVYDAGHRFDEDFLVGKHGLMGDDSEFVARLARQGFRIGFAPHARVRHIIGKEQLSWRWMFRRAFRFGRSEIMQAEMPETDNAEAPDSRFPYWRIRRAAAALLKLVLLAPTLDRGRVFEKTQLLARDLGALRQAWLLVRRNRRPGAA
jgi:GT2 family glycosyltransferase